MKERDIHIDKLEIRLPKGAKLSARQIAEGLGREILSQISDAPIGRTDSARIEKLDAGKIKMRGKRSIPGLQKQIAGKVVSEVKRSVAGRRKK